MTNSCKRLSVVLCSLVFLGFQNTAHAWETDQFTNRLKPLRDSTVYLNRKFNQKIQQIIDYWSEGEGEDRALFAFRFNKLMVNALTTGRYEHWLNKSNLIDRVETTEDNIYMDASVLYSRWNWFFGLSATILVNGVRIGTDKPGHFLAEGYSYYYIGEVLKRGDQEAIAYGVNTENGYFGYWVSGVYSNADLVANFEGYRFYKSLFEDNVIEGKPAILKWENGFPVLQRPFDWADHINEFWDEALNPSQLNAGLQASVYTKLKSYCPDYESSPQSFLPSQKENELRTRYLFAGLVENVQNRMDYVCGQKN